MGDPDRHVRKAAVVALSAVVHHKPALVTSGLDELMPLLLDQTVIKQDMVRLEWIQYSTVIGDTVPTSALASQPRLMRMTCWLTYKTFVYQPPASQCICNSVNTKHLSAGHGIGHRDTIRRLLGTVCP
jgi:hypothetical protein